MIPDYGIIRSFAHAVEWASGKYKKDPVSFLLGCFAWSEFNSYNENYTLFTQSSSCIAGKILDKLSFEGIEVASIKNPEEIILDKEDGFWMGYIAMYWITAKNGSGKELLCYDWELIRDAYDTLHTTDPSYTIDFIKKNYKKN